jgi:hypothetical protein
MKTLQIPEDLDKGIEDLFVKLNTIPFVETFGSCEGHVRDSLYWELTGNIEAEPGKKYITPGSMVFTSDGDLSESAGDFIKDVEDLANKYLFTQLLREPDYGVEIHNPDLEFYTLKLNCEDLYTKPKKSNHPNLIKRLEIDLKRLAKSEQTNLDSALERAEGYRQVWEEFENIADKYLLKETYNQ